MTTESDALTALILGAQEGSSGAAGALVQHFGPHIRRVIRCHLDKRLSDKLDLSDIEQEVWIVFLGHILGRKQLDASELCAYLEGLARNKVREAHRHYRRKKRNVARERSLDDGLSVQPDALARAGTEGPLDDEDEWECWLKKHPLNIRQIVSAMRAGQSLAEIAESRSICPKTVRRLLQSLAEEAQQASACHPPPIDPQYSIIFFLSQQEGFPSAILRQFRGAGPPSVARVSEAAALGALARRKTRAGFRTFVDFSDTLCRMAAGRRTAAKRPIPWDSATPPW